MTKLEDAINDRHSVRDFKEDEVPWSLVEEILEAGCQAPSSKNEQPWKVAVIGQPRLSWMAEEMLGWVEDRKVRRTLEIMSKAPICLLVFLDKTESSPRYIAHVQSIGAFMENMMLKAHDLGLGTLWCGDILNCSEEVKDFFRLKDRPVAALLIGYEGQKWKRKRHKDVDDILIRGYDEGPGDDSSESKPDVKSRLRNLRLRFRCPETVWHDPGLPRDRGMPSGVLGELLLLQLFSWQEAKS